MNNKTFFLLRHAQSVYNQQGIIQGAVDTPLSMEGREQVRSKAHVFKQFGFRNIVHSPLARAKETAEYINNELELPMIVKEELKEMDFGEWNAGTKVEYWDQFKRQFYEFGEAPPGGESKNELFKRVNKAVHEICNDVKEYPILIVAHGMVNRVLLGEWFTNSSEKSIRALKMGNLALYKVELKYDANKIEPVKYEYINIDKL